MCAKMDDAKLRQVVAKVLDVDPASLRDDSSPDTIDGWDSLKSIDLVLALEEAYGVRFTDDQMTSLTSLRLIGSVVREALGEPNQ